MLIRMLIKSVQNNICTVSERDTAGQYQNKYYIYDPIL